jgi:UDP-N-acetylmuramate--alanine ligase
VSAEKKSYFFCGVGGSGMLPLALILRGEGASVSGSDRSLDQGRTSAKFDFLRGQGIALFPQDGSGVTDAAQTLVISAAVEDTVPDVVAAKSIGAEILKRPQLLAQLFNNAKRSIGVAGTSGKSTTTGMIGWILDQAGRDPTIMNGAVMKNFVTPEALFASARVGKGEEFVSEVDESDGSIALYRPSVAVLNNIALDHKSMEELRSLFGDFLRHANVAVINLDNAEAARLAAKAKRALTYSLENQNADFYAANITPRPDGVAFELREKTGASIPVLLQTPGRHNISNALAAVAAARAVGVSTKQAAAALQTFSGIRRRLERVGVAGGVTIYDDFAHNPDKIAATLATLHDFPGRLLIMFQPHGFGPLKLMRNELIEVFAQRLAPNDILIMPEPVYFGGTVDRAVSSADIVGGVVGAGRIAFAFADRVTCGDKLLSLAHDGDRIVIMGARDDTLSQFAEELLAKLTPDKPLDNAP